MAIPKIFIFHIATTSCIQICEDSKCSGSTVPIHFPFHLKESKGVCRAYNTSFDILCGGPDQTIISLPFGEFSVKSIDYMFEKISINDLNHCLARQFLAKNFTVGPSFFLKDSVDIQSYTFLNCTPNVTNKTTYYDLLPVNCLSGDNYIVVAVLTYDYLENTLDGLCNVVSKSLLPNGIDGKLLGLDGSDIVLQWSIINCLLCQLDSGTCGFTNDTSLEIWCSTSPPHSNYHTIRGRSPGGIVAVAVFVISFLIVVICIFSCCKTTRQRRQQSSIELTVPIGSRPVPNSIGLDKATVETYPKTVLSKISKQLLDPSSNVCSICPSNYNLGETIRTIPNCDHYFHIICIDEWLVKNATCPLCRDFLGGALLP